ncbi:alpha/beta hydrolase fold domain-containing protein [Peribacillus butanolivorans]|uniref:alpha/beta hydrolase fold domain-containing protein n=1 Tax=Peribacillus butanolivorans TaxID=421767 RepID=UPI003648734B
MQLGEVYNYIKKHKEDFPVDLDRIVVGGDSAGAQISGQFVNIQTNNKYAERIGIEPTIIPSKLKGYISFSGLLHRNGIDETDSKFANFLFRRCAWAYIDDKHWKGSPAANQASVIDNVTDQFPPTYLTDGNKGSFETHAIELIETLKNKGVEVTSLLLDINEENLGMNISFQWIKQLLFKT